MRWAIDCNMAPYICCCMALPMGVVKAESKNTGPLVFSHCAEKKAPAAQCHTPPTGLRLFSENSCVMAFCNWSCIMRI